MTLRACMLVQKFVTHLGEVDEHVVGSDVQLML